MIFIFRQEANEKELNRQKQSFLEALDFSKVRSREDAELLNDARTATQLGEKMSRDQVNVSSSS